jgi:hypothetical protein
MPIVNHFYNGTTRKYVALFGTLFNKMSITRENATGEQIQRLLVPISYGPAQAYLARMSQDPNLDKKSAVTLPRMSFEITGMNFDDQRKTPSANKHRHSLPSTKGTGTADFVYTPAPYDINFSLTIMTKYAEDGSKIVEQIIPFFKPDFTTSVKVMPGMEPLDIKLILNDVTSEDIYETDFKSRQTLLWTLNFTMKAFFYGPKRDASVIKFIDVSMFEGDSDTPFESIKTRPGMTADREPTTNLADTIPIEQIDFGDDWGIITYFEDVPQ